VHDSTPIGDAVSICRLMQVDETYVVSLGITHDKAVENDVPVTVAHKKQLTAFLKRFGFDPH